MKRCNQNLFAGDNIRTATLRAIGEKKTTNETHQAKSNFKEHCIFLQAMIQVYRKVQTNCLLLVVWSVRNCNILLLEC